MHNKGNEMMANYDANLYPQLAPSAPPPGADMPAPYPTHRQQHANPPAYSEQVTTVSGDVPQQTYYIPNQSPIIIQQQNFGPYPTRVLCPACNKETMTKTEPVSGSLAYLLSMALCICGCFCCFCIPCCIDRTRDVIHKCRNCGHLLGQYKRL